MAKDAPQAPQGGTNTPPQQGASSGTSQPQGTQPIFRDWAAI